MVNYSELRISDQNKALEKRVIEQISQAMDERRSWAFDAGAGSGKTYALVQSLNLMLEKRGSALSAHRQKVLCITYTNVAANEIKSRLKNTPIVLVSTIHERLWDINTPYKRELLRLHQRKLQEEIAVRQDELRDEVWAQAYRNLETDQAAAFDKYIQDFEFKIRFYQVYDANAPDFRAALSDIVGNYPSMTSNVGNLKKVIRHLHTIANYRKTLTRTKKQIVPALHMIHDLIQTAWQVCELAMIHCWNMRIRWLMTMIG